jgi:hypothetical protein
MRRKTNPSKGLVVERKGKRMSYIRTKKWLIARQTLEDLIAAHLYAMSAVNDDDDITKIDFEVKVDHDFPDLVPIKVTLKRREGGS